MQNPIKRVLIGISTFKPLILRKITQQSYYSKILLNQSTRIEVEPAMSFVLNMI